MIPCPFSRDEGESYFKKRTEAIYDRSEFWTCSGLAKKHKMVKPTVAAYYLTIFVMIMYATLPTIVQAGMMKKGGGMGGTEGVMQLLVAGIVAKLLGDMKMQKGGSSSKTKYVPVPIYVASGMGMMDSGWKGGMMDSGWKGGMMMNSGGWKGNMMMNSGWNKGMMMGGD